MQKRRYVTPLVCQLDVHNDVIMASNVDGYVNDIYDDGWEELL